MAWGDKRRYCLECGTKFYTRLNVLCQKCRRKAKREAKKA